MYETRLEVPRKHCRCRCEVKLLSTVLGRALLSAVLKGTFARRCIVEDESDDLGNTKIGQVAYKKTGNADRYRKYSVSFHFGILPNKSSYRMIALGYENGKMPN